MASKLIIDRIPPDMHIDENGKIVWTPRLIDFNAVTYSRGHTITSSEFTTELTKQTYQGNYNTDTISILIELYNNLNTDVTTKANTANSNSAAALSRVSIAETNSVEALNVANTALNTSVEALSDVQTAVDASTQAVTIAENTVAIAEAAKALSDEASDNASYAMSQVEEAVRIAESADGVAVNAENISNEAKRIAENANILSTSAHTASNSAVTTANTAYSNAEDAKIISESALLNANKAITDSSTAINTANTAISTANSASNTATQALTKANEAVTTANSTNTIANEAKADSANAVQIANAASANIDAAVNTANTAKNIAELSATTVAGKASTDYVDNVLKDYYNKTIIDQLLNNVSVDLSGYYTSVQTDNLLSYYAKKTDIPNVSAFITKSVNDLDNYYTKTETDNVVTQTLNSAKGYTDTKIAALIDSAPETLDTFKEIADAFAEDQAVLDALNNAIGLKADKAALDAANAYITTNTTNIALLQNSKADRTDLNAYVTTDVLNGKGYLTSIPSEYVTETELTAKNYATKSEIPSTSGLATKSELGNYLPLSGGTVSGAVGFQSSINVVGDMLANYVAVTSAGHETGTYDKIATLSSTGYIRYRTKAEVKSDMGVPTYSLDGTTLTITL